MLLSDCLKLFVFDWLVYLPGWLHSMGVGCTRASEWEEAGWEGDEEKVPGGEEEGGGGVCTVEELDADGDLFSPCTQTRWKWVGVCDVNQFRHTHTQWDTPLLFQSHANTCFTANNSSAADHSEHTQTTPHQTQTWANTRSNTQIRVSPPTWVMMSGCHLCQSHKNRKPFFMPQTVVK